MVTQLIEDFLYAGHNGELSEVPQDLLGQETFPRGAEKGRHGGGRRGGPGREAEDGS